VDLGSIANFQSPASGSTFNLGSALANNFGSANGLFWSVFTFDGNGTYAPVNTLFMSAPRADVTVPNSPPTTGTASQQNLVTGQLGAIADALSATYGTIVANQVIQLPNGLGSSNGGDPASYTTALGTSLDFNGTYSQSFENLSSTSATVSDLFQENPSPLHNPGAGVYLGSFTLAGDGSSLAFSPSPVPEPTTLAMIGTGLFSLVAFRRLAKRH
jgi:hypothetical protein